MGGRLVNSGPIVVDRRRLRSPKCPAHRVLAIRPVPIGVRRQLASAVGLTQSHFPSHARLSSARVAEYQKRAAVHVHAVVRLDGSDGPNDEPPAWGSADRLADAVHASARRVLVRTPYSPAVGELALRWGAQIDARPLRADRAEHVGQEATADTDTDVRWRYVGSGHSPGGALIAAGIADDLAGNRAAAREAANVSPGRLD